MMHGYSDFPKHVKSIFENIIHDFDLTVVHESPTDIIFKSEKCILGLFTEYDLLQLCFKQREEENWMFLGPYLDAMFPNEKITIRQPQENLNRIEKIIFSLNETLGLVKKYCIPILVGDFSWKDKYQL